MNRLGRAARYYGSLATALLAAVLGTACAFHEDELMWGNCCALEIAAEKTGSKERETLLVWGRANYFHGDGSNDRDGAKAWRNREIGSGLADFERVHPGSQGRDYLTSLGMTCGVPGPKTERTRCTVELSVWAKCTAKLSWYFPGPVPKAVSKPIAAMLQMNIDVSASDILDSSVRIVPIQGGRLCER